MSYDFLQNIFDADQTPELTLFFNQNHARPEGRAVMSHGRDTRQAYIPHLLEQLHDYL
jgi:hypothetical protein